MKKLLSLLAFLLVLASFTTVEGNGNSNSSSNWSTQWPGYVTHWLQTGGPIPQPLAMMVLREARAWGSQNFGLSLGQMHQKYNNGELTIEYLEAIPPLPVLVFRVSYGGGQVILDIEDAG